MSGVDVFLEACIQFSLAVLTVSFLLTVYRIVTGPTLPDRIVALDMLVAVGIGFIAVIGVKTRYYLYLDIAITLGLVGFLATVAFARFVLNRGLAGDSAITEETERDETSKTHLSHSGSGSDDAKQEDHA